MARYILAVAAGKGGVGKSLVAANLARSLQYLGFSVGLIDADIYGPSLKKMLREDQPPSFSEQGINPAFCEGLKLISMAHFTKHEGESTVVRAPIANGMMVKFARQVLWGELDYIIVDFPPGTGDIHLTLMQQLQFTAALIVTMPQEISLLDVRKALDMFHKMDVPIAGIVENMSFYVDPITKEERFLFGRGGGKKLAEEEAVPLLAEIPIDPLLSQLADEGLSCFSKDAWNSSTEIFLTLGRVINDRLWHLSLEENGTKIKQLHWEVSDTSFAIEWTDGPTQRFCFADLQRNCPCTGCRDGDGRFTAEISSITSDLRAKRIHRLGRYALKIDFTSGCSRGIYTFDLLRNLLLL